MAAADLWEKIYIKEPSDDSRSYVLYIDNKFIDYANTRSGAWYKAEAYIDNEFKKERDNKPPK